jgi:hypothetical protein
MRFVRGDARGPHRYTQNRPSFFGEALQGASAAKRSKEEGIR